MCAKNAKKFPFLLRLVDLMNHVFNPGNKADKTVDFEAQEY